MKKIYAPKRKQSQLNHSGNAYQSDSNTAPVGASLTPPPFQLKTSPTTLQRKTAPIQRACNVKSALYYYEKSKSGKKIKWTKGLVEELYKVVGTGHKALYEQALASGVIDANFVTLVCKAQEILGFTGRYVDGKIGPKTIGKWENWKTGGKKGINYNRLLEDKKLEIGIAVGHEFHSSEFVAIQKLLNEKYDLELTNDTDSRKTYTGKRTYKVQGDNTAKPVEIDVIIDMISAKSKNAKKSFGEFLSQKEISLYSGHARYGTSPDFDDKKSPAENFVIGVNSALHKAGKVKKGYNAKMNKILKGKANDLERLSKNGKFDKDLYQVWFFNACTSLQYLDEIRGGLVRDKDGNVKSSENLRVMGTKKSIVSDAIPIVIGLLEMQSMEEIMKAMAKYEAKNAGGSGRGIFFSD